MNQNKRRDATPAATVYNGIYQSLCTLTHFIASVQNWYGIYYNYVYVHFPAGENAPVRVFGGKFIYLTFLCAIIQALYFTISLINDFIGTNVVNGKQLPMIRKVKDYMMSAFAFPIAMNVGILFWSLYAIDRELIFPKILDSVFPNWLNHVMHTNIIVFVILEMFISYRAYPTRFNGLMGLSAFMLAYLIWLHVIKYMSNVWVYPVLDILPLPLRIVFFLASFAFTLGCYVLGETINNIVWCKELKLSQRKAQ